MNRDELEQAKSEGGNSAAAAATIAELQALLDDAVAGQSESARANEELELQLGQLKVNLAGL